MPSKEYWDRVYNSSASDSLSWFQSRAAVSLDLIHATGAGHAAAIVDVGGGTSTLVDDLLANGYTDLSVLDLSAAALTEARRRLGEQAGKVQWLEADITQAELPKKRYDIWHDRAVFHFLTTQKERDAYVRNVYYSVKPGGHVIIATFAEDGPDKCSGLPVMRYRADDLHDEFGEAFTLLKHQKETHQTPLGTEQQFMYCYCRRVNS